MESETRKYLKKVKEMLGSNIDIDSIEQADITEKCPFCSSPSLYSYDYDAYYCEKCNVWLEAECGDENCEFCRERPERPL